MKALLVISALVLLSCDKLSSKFGSPEAPPPVIAEKPAACSVELHRTCWSDTVREITSCMEKSKSQDQFQNDMHFCSNKEGKFVHFENAPFLNNYDPFISTFTLNFFANKNQTKCFSMEEKGPKVTISVPGYDDIYIYRDQDQLIFSCLDGQEIRVKQKTLEGCEKKNGLDSIPGVALEPFFENGSEQGWRLRFRGASDGTEVFRCHY